MTHICVGNLTIIASDNGLSPGRCQAIIWTNDVILLIRPLGTHSSEILIEFLTFRLKKMRLNVSSAKWRPFCLNLNVLIIMVNAWSSPSFQLGYCYPMHEYTHYCRVHHYIHIHTPTSWVQAHIFMLWVNHLSLFTEPNACKEIPS